MPKAIKKQLNNQRRIANEIDIGGGQYIRDRHFEIAKSSKAKGQHKAENACANGDEKGN
jgi:hypothetical protein